MSGRAVRRALRTKGFPVLMIDPADPAEMARRLRRIEVAFLALHGHGGEDGVIQRFLEERRVPYVGSDARGSLNAFDKLRSKRLFMKSGIPTAPFVVVRIADWRRKLSRFKPPYFVKPPLEGSSIGVFEVEDFDRSTEKIREALLQYGKLLIEQKIDGREFTVGVLEGTALPPIELLPKRSFYDFRAKYTKGMTDYCVPARISKALWKHLQAMALRVHRCLGLRDLSRTDIMVDRRGRPYVLESNSIPGFTQFSLLPKAAKVAGISFEDLCGLLVEWAYTRRTENEAWPKRKK